MDACRLQKSKKQKRTSRKKQSLTERKSFEIDNDPILQATSGLVGDKQTKDCSWGGTRKDEFVVKYFLCSILFCVHQFDP